MVSTQYEEQQVLVLTVSAPPGVDNAGLGISCTRKLQSTRYTSDGTLQRVTASKTFHSKPISVLLTICRSSGYVLSSEIKTYIQHFIIMTTAKDKWDSVKRQTLSLPKSIEYIRRFFSLVALNKLTKRNCRCYGWKKQNSTAVIFINHMIMSAIWNKCAPNGLTSGRK